MAAKSAQVMFLLQRYPHLDWLMCDTLLSVPHERLVEYLKEEPLAQKGQCYVLKGVHVEENLVNLEKT